MMSFHLSEESFSGLKATACAPSKSCFTGHCAFQANWYVPEPMANTMKACGLTPSTCASRPSMPPPIEPRRRRRPHWRRRSPVRRHLPLPPHLLTTARPGPRLRPSPSPLTFRTRQKEPATTTGWRRLGDLASALKIAARTSLPICLCIGVLLVVIIGGVRANFQARAQRASSRVSVHVTKGQILHCERPRAVFMTRSAPRDRPCTRATG